MSTGTPRNFDPNQTTGTPTATLQVAINLIPPLVVIVGLFVLLALGKVQSDVALPIIAGIVGYHGGAAITNNSNAQ